MQVDLGAGNGSKADPGQQSANTGTITNVETIAGAAGADTITLGSSATSGGSIDLGSGARQPDLGKDGTNSATISNVESILTHGGARAPTPSPSARR